MQYEFTGEDMPQLAYCDGNVVYRMDHMQPIDPSTSERTLFLMSTLLRIATKRVDDAIEEKERAGRGRS